jgi:transforming growth factor-beta-induced protein
MVSPMKKYANFAAMAVISAGMGLGMAACSSPSATQEDSGMSMTGAQLSKPSEDIIQIATGDNMGEVSTLVKAVEAAGLVDTLKGPGPFTVFAPTNAAFAKLPPDTLADLLKPENKDKLRDILLYHVIAGQEVMAADVKTMTATMADKKPLSVSVSDGVVTLSSPTSSAKVIKTDIMAKNGVIHWIDTVLMPPAN